MDRFIPKSKSKLLYQSHTQSNYNDVIIKPKIVIISY